MANESIAVSFGKRVRQLREKRGWHQVDLAAHSGLGRTFISNLENGKHEPKLSTIKALADSFGISMGKLLSGL
jgi:HTH-type transcriptional regulator / antitoxin HipB